jgi:hypothetical protein
MMKPGKRNSNRIRVLVRQHGWTQIKVKATDEHPDPGKWDSNLNNTLNYHQMQHWCEENLGAGVWASSLHSYVGTNQPGARRFAFEREADATLFALTWL